MDDDEQARITALADQEIAAVTILVDESVKLATELLGTSSERAAWSGLTVFFGKQLELIDDNHYHRLAAECLAQSAIRLAHAADGSLDEMIKA